MSGSVASKPQVRCPYCHLLVDAREDGKPMIHATKEVRSNGKVYRPCKGGKSAEAKA